MQLGSHESWRQKETAKANLTDLLYWPGNSARWYKDLGFYFLPESSFILSLRFSYICSNLTSLLKPMHILGTMFRTSDFFITSFRLLFSFRSHYCHCTGATAGWTYPYQWYDDYLLLLWCGNVCSSCASLKGVSNIWLLFPDGLF